MSSPLEILDSWASDAPRTPAEKAILEKAIQKAIDGGWKTPRGNTLRVTEDGSIASFVDGQPGIYAFGLETSKKEIIFNHDFAKALWGQTQSCHAFEDMRGKGLVWLPEWQYHLQQMVISEDPIKYLGENI